MLNQVRYSYWFNGRNKRTLNKSRGTKSHFLKVILSPPRFVARYRFLLMQFSVAICSEWRAYRLELLLFVCSSGSQPSLCSTTTSMSYGVLWHQGHMQFFSTVLPSCSLRHYPHTTEPCTDARKTLRLTIETAASNVTLQFYSFVHCSCLLYTSPSPRDA